MVMRFDWSWDSRVRCQRVRGSRLYSVFPVHDLRRQEGLDGTRVVFFLRVSSFMADTSPSKAICEIMAEQTPEFHFN